MALELLCTLGLGLFIVWFVKTWVEYRTWIRRDGIRQIHGLTTFLSNISDLASIFNTSSTFVLGQFQLWISKTRWYNKSGWDVCAAVSVFPRVQTTFIIGDPVLFQHVASSRTAFPKFVEQYSLLRMFGKNIVTEEGDEWKNFKRICAPAFSERNNRLVWDCAISIMNEFFKDVWEWDVQGTNSEEIEVDDFKMPCSQLTLRVIVAASFSQKLSWSHSKKTNISQPKPDNLATPEKMTIEEIFETISEGMFYKLVVPEWVLRNAEWIFWPLQRTKTELVRVREAFDALHDYMQDFITTRRDGIFTSSNGLINSGSTQADLFSNLLEANEGEGDLEGSEIENTKTDQSTRGRGSRKMNDSELMGNVFIFLLAGHETSAHTICFAIAMLALYPEEQEKLYKHIISVLPNGRLPTYEDLPRLTRTMAVLQETLRLFAPVVGIPKKAAEDTTLITTNPNTGETLTIPIEKGSQISLHPPGLHYNSKYWDDPELFSPDRFMPGSNWPRDAFAPFSAGARSCIGRRFAEIESVAIITMFVMRYRVKVKEEEEFRAETFEQRKERILRSRNGITLTPIRVPLVFTQRQ